MSIIITPKVSEKAYSQAGTLNTYVFNVPKDVNKIEIKKAIESEYGVNVIDVNVVNTQGKVKQSYRKGGRAIKGNRSDSRKAYVRVEAGQTIPVFASQEEENK